MLNREKLIAVFSEIDKDNDGYLTLAELHEGFKTYREMNPEGDSFNEEEVELYFSIADEDNDGKVSYEEFVKSMELD